MNVLTARPQLLKQANLTSIRKVIKNKFTATRAEIAAETKISSTTVRSLLTEMLENGEIESIGFDESSGGRKAERYRFRPERYHGAAFCMTADAITFLLINVCGEITETLPLCGSEADFETTVFPFLDGLTGIHEIKAIGIGVPGVPDGDGYRRQDPATGELRRIEIGRMLTERYGIPVVLENNVNAITFGFARRRARENPNEAPDADTAYLHFERGCVKAGLIANGAVLRGCNRFAGELGLIPVDGERTLDDLLAEPTDDARYVRLVAHIVGWICGTLNPKRVVLGGPALRTHCIDAVADRLSALLPADMAAQLLRSPDAERDYREGMAYLTAEKLFDDVQFVKE